MKNIVLALLLSVSAYGQGVFKTVYQDFLKYGTVYAAGDASNSYEASRKEYFVRTPDGGTIYDIPLVEDVTEYFPFDYRLGFGIRKLGRFDYERKPNNFWTGNQKIEKQIALDAPTSSVEGLEYLFHYEVERLRGETWINNRYFIRHTGKHHIVKLESRVQGAYDFNYKAAEARYRLPIGKKFSLSAGVIYRTHDRAYGYNPFEIWVNEVDADGYPINPWYSLGYMYGYSDHPFESSYIDPTTGADVTKNDYFWINSNGETVANSDYEFRDEYFEDLINRYNNDIWDQLGSYGLVSPIIGFDFYHYKPKFWMHAYANYLLPYHTYVQGDKEFSYLNRFAWGLGGLNPEMEQQWADYQFGNEMGWHVSKSFGIFIEGEYTRYWDTEVFTLTVGFNYTFK